MTETSQLGEVLKSFPPSSYEVRRAWIWFAAASLTGLVVGVFISAQPDLDPRAKFEGGLVVSAIACALTCMWLIPAIMRSGQSVTFHEHGFVFSRKALSTPVGYDEVKGFDENIEMNAWIPALTRIHTLQPILDGERQIVLSEGGIADFEGVRTYLLDAVASTLVPRFVARLKADEEIDSGAVKFQRRGILVANKTIPWHKVTGTTLHPSEGTVQIETDSGTVDTKKRMLKCPPDPGPANMLHKRGSSGGT
jgi:hypothetical protein